MQKLKIFMDDVNRRLSTLESFVRQIDAPEELGNRIKAIEERLFTRKDRFNLVEACEYIGISESTMYKLTSAKQIPHFKRGKFIYFERADIDRWMNGDRVATVDETIESYFEQRPDLLSKKPQK